MKISRISAQGVIGLPSLDCELVSRATGRPHDLIVVTGPAASGKTRLCELILAVLEIVGPYEGIVRASDWVADPKEGARVEIGLWLDDEERRIAAPSENPTHALVKWSGDRTDYEIHRGVSRLLSRYDHDPAHGKREYFPEGRQRAWGARSDGLGALEQSLLRCSKDPHKYSVVGRFLATLGDDSRRLRVFADGLASLSPTARYTDVTAGASGFTNRDGDGVSFGDLSSSEADAVLIAATIAMTGLSHSIAIVDRPELSVSPSRLVSWVESLASLGVDNQWIVASNDARLAASVDPSQIVSLGANDSLRSSARPSGRPS